MTKQNVAKATRTRQKFIVAAVAASCAGSALAFDFKTDSGWTGALTTTVSVGASVRAEDRDKSLIAPMNAVSGIGMGWEPNYMSPPNAGTNPFTGAPYKLAFSPAFTPVVAAPAHIINTFYSSAYAGYTGASTGTTGNLNYAKGDIYSSPIKVLTELSLRKDNMGALLRAKAWYDDALNNRNVAWGNQATKFAAGKPLSDAGAPDLAKFDGIYLLDAYAYTGFDLGDNPAQIRVGRQAINWGESIFFQGVNHISPLDVIALRRAGTEIKEALLPIWAVSGSIGLPGGTSLEGFYQAKWEQSAIDGCGTYWAGGIHISDSAGPCNMIASIGANNSDRTAFATGSYAKFIDGKKASDSGQWGLAFRFPVESLDTEFGLYAMNINSRLPVLSYLNSSAFGLATLPKVSAFLEFPDDIKIFGLSAGTTLAGISWGAELSRHIDVPVMANPADLLIAVGTYSRNGLSTNPATFTKGPMGARAVAAGLNGYVRGWDRFNKTQFQLNGVSMLPSMLGAVSGTAIGEAMFQWNNVPDYTKDGNLRYGRPQEFGFATSSIGDSRVFRDGNLSSACNESAFGPQFQQDGCKVDGFITDFAWGYRLRAQLDYPDAFNTGVTFSPIVFFAHDVKGVSLDSQLNEGRQTVSLTLRLNRNKIHNLDINYTTYANSAKYDAFRDRDNYSLAYSYTF